MRIRRLCAAAFCLTLAAVTGTALPAAASQTTAAGPALVRPMAYSPAGCTLHAGRRPHIQTSPKHKGERWADAFEFTSCKRNVSTLYLSVSLYKTDLFGSYFEGNVHHTVHGKKYVASSPEVKCSNDTQSTNFFAISYSYSIESGKTYSAEGTSPTVSLKCGTPGGSG
jgi:hypothetical protein